MSRPLATLLASLLLGLVAAVPSFGQDKPGPVEKAPLPPPPYLRGAPDTAAWVITFEMPGDGAAKPSPKSIRQIDATKVGDTRREISIRNDGTSSEDWYYKGVHLIRDPAAGYVVAFDRYEAQTEAPSTAAIDFFDFTWVDAKTFGGKSTMAGHDCYYYHYSDAAGPGDAWIDAKTGLPVALQNKAGLRVYQFTNPSVASLTLPADFQAAYDRHEKQLHRSKAIEASIPR